ncbi:hypothetical protein QA639_09595 [Bradyrhizobium pachyrhizi]|uniref:hypothetical protein n=1 Tax=Bradyrhizobium TaxID=374 RepID=UPI0024B27E13|nr:MULTISPECIES: hypothetical protein [Bradyrhizobium]WFU57735.1 hypothetical protein QA639_09595 [Bradyrhizobium pachyrhizi]WOH83277.1 hypothetical protein RX327_09130 [Bradyrhizobium sp. BEA-2-5]
MIDLQAILIRGSEKIIGHYQYLLDTATSELEREGFRQRIHEQQLLDKLRQPELRARAA